MESEIKELRRENETLKRETEACQAMNNKLRRSLGQTTKHSKLQLQKIAELNEKLSAERERHSEENTGSSNLGEIQMRLNRTANLLSQTKEELNEMRQRLSDVQERLTVAEQVTAATQQRALQESDNSEQLQRELTLQHRPTECTGIVLIFERLLLVHQERPQDFW